MKMPNDSRVWFDSSREATVYNAYDDQRFYSILYEGKHADRVMEFANQTREFSRWVRDYMLAHQSGQQPPEPPAFIVEGSNKWQTTESAPAKAKRGRPRKQPATEAGTSTDKPQDSSSAESSSTTNPPTE